MRIDLLEVENFRRFDHLQVPFHPQMTVLAARNGQGKTTVLDAVALALAPFIGAFDDGRGENLKRSDARYEWVAEEHSSIQNFPVGVLRCQDSC